MTTLYFVRHAQSDITVCQDDIRPLTEKGFVDAEALVSVFNKYKIEAIYSSPYKRCIDTVAPLAKDRNLLIKTDNALRERDSGGWIGNFDEYVRHQWSDFGYKSENGESLYEVQSRVIESLNIILASRFSNTVISCHGTALSILIEYFKPRSGYDFFIAIKGKMPVIIKMEFTAGSYIKHHLIDLQTTIRSEELI